MGLFVVRHQHPAERCPAADPRLGAGLLQHLSGQNAAAAGITIKAEAVVNDAHTFYLIVEAADQGQVERFLTPFAQAGTVEVMPSSTCETVVDRGGCAPLAASA